MTSLFFLKFSYTFLSTVASEYNSLIRLTVSVVLSILAGTPRHCSLGIPGRSRRVRPPVPWPPPGHRGSHPAGTTGDEGADFGDAPAVKYVAPVRLDLRASRSQSGPQSRASSRAVRVLHTRIRVWVLRTRFFSRCHGNFGKSSLCAPVLWPRKCQTYSSITY